MNKINLHLGDCLESMRAMADNSVDSVVTDPPYGIRFMGKAWDGADIDARAEARRMMRSHSPDAGPNGGHKSIAAEAGKYDLKPGAMRAFQEFSEDWAREAFRVLKPGGYLLSFSSARTYHRMTSGIEDAGFEIRDQILWVYGSGFPKSHNLKGEWQGWGTALKPSHEPIAVARKPLVGTVAANVLEHSTGALNIDGCRVAGEPMAPNTGAGGLPRRNVDEHRGPGIVAQPHELGRWPANLIHDGSDEVLAHFPAKAGACSPVKGTESSMASIGAVTGERGRVMGAFHGDTGSAARFFYCAKASKSDRDAGLGEFELKEAGIKNESGRGFSESDPHRKIMRANTHPTVKPTDLMSYLVRLVTPPGGVVLDPFMGSGSTGKAAMREGMRFVGCEMDPAYMAIARARIEHEQHAVEAARLAAIPQPVPQLDLFAS